MTEGSPTLSLLPHATYVKELRADLPPEAFEPAKSRALLVPFYVAVIALATAAIANDWLGWYLWPVLSVVIGVSISCLMFVSHETLHGGIVKGKSLKYAIGWICFAPFMMSPRMWMGWHNRIHHGNTNLPLDPDKYPTIEEYRTDKRVRVFIDWFSPGGSRWRGLSSLLFGFSVHSALQLFTSVRQGFLSASERRLAMTESAFALSIWVLLAVVIGPLAFVFAFLLPLVVANIIIMSFILTNHGLSPLVDVNDPVVSGLSVTTSRLVDRLTLNFGFHVEHHIFPAMSSRHAPLVRSLILDKWPERYQTMSLAKALVALHRTSRVYKDPVTLIDPRTGEEFPALVPSEPFVS